MAVEFAQGDPDVRASDQTFETIRESIRIFVQNRFVAVGLAIDWSSTNYFVVFVEVIAYLGALLTYKINALVREAFMVTARLPESIRRHALYLGYEAPARTAATALVKITLGADTAFPIVIPIASKFYSVGGESQIVFQTLEEFTIPPSSEGDEFDIWVENSENFSAEFQADGTPNQEFITTQRPVLRSGIDGSGNAVAELIAFSVDAVPYTVVDSLLESEPADLYVVLTNTSGGRLRAKTGNGIRGAIPLGTVLIEGRAGGGSSGNNATITQGPTLVNNNGDVIPATYLNSVVSGGGADEPTLAEIRVEAPLSLKTNNRTVGSEDFVINTEAVSGIDRALTLTRNDDVTVPLNTSHVIVLSDSPTNAQLVGGNAAAIATTNGVSDQFMISLHGETPQLIDLGTLASGEVIAAAIQTAVRALEPEFPLDNEEAYASFTCTFDTVNVRYILTSGQASLSSSVAITAGTFDAAVALKITAATLNTNTLGAAPAAGTIAAVFTQLTETKPVPASHVVEIKSPGIEIINIDVTVRFASDFSTALLKSQVRDEIRAALIAFFSPRNSDSTRNTEVEFGKTMRVSNLISVADGVTGVDHIDEDAFLPADDVVVDSRAFPVLGGILVRDILTGDPV